jgi:hypothetical protein
VSNELEVAAGASAGGFVGRLGHKHAPPAGALCANCATPLQGPWCHACGQLGEDFHRSVARLGAELAEGLLHADGRLWRTLPDLMARPARLTRGYLDGHRAPQIPPLRLFLVVLLAIFLVGGITGGSKLGRVNSTTTGNGGLNVMTTTTGAKPIAQLTRDERAEVSRKVANLNVDFGTGKKNVAASQWLRDRLERTWADPARFELILEQWSERFTFLMLPIAALLLSLLFIFQRRFYLFDHTIFSLHSLSAMGLLLTAGMLLNGLIGGWVWLLALAAPVHLFAHMRGVYRTSVAGTLLRMFLLFVGSVIAALALIVGLVAVGLNGMGG